MPAATDLRSDLDLDPNIETRLFINNEFVSAHSNRKFPVVNPWNGEVTALVHEADATDVDLAVNAAEGAFPSWSTLGGFQRAEYFYRLADLYEKNNDVLAELEARSMGRPVSTYTEGLASARFLRYMAGKATDIQGESSLQTANFMNITLRQPYGVCAGITPWNAPVTMLTFKFGPALISGNTMVLKSSEKAPLTSLYIAKLIQQAGFPPGVVNILSGFGQPCGEALASHMRIRKISLTGSIRAGQAIKRLAAMSNLKHVTLELGGKSPLVIFNDADISKAATAASESILLNSGQACIASTRIYVQKGVVKTFCNELVAALEMNGCNPPDDNNPLSRATKRGPQACKTQFDSIVSFIKEAQDCGYETLTGGHAEGGNGYYIQPTVIYQPAEKSRIMQEEIFGPVQCVLSFEDEDEVLRRANDTEFGLYASVFTKDIFRALRFVRGFESGNIGINCTSPMMTHDMPFGGVKQSGEGRELGKHAMEEWTEPKTVYFALQ